MLTTLTSKGQLTLPKEIREKLGLVSGSKLDFTIETDGSLRVRSLHRGAADLFGLLHDQKRRASSVEQMNAAMGQHLAELDARCSTAATPATTPPTTITRRKAHR
ncbi:MAG: AbrB/MazE/SpoVT family DNA-binding domain-containing protein [Rhodocyclaceae bacterium]|nr:AbrB/MazE/SpoVT family DNA-binding domain-containing protein [Rhodocyclaceae bacterium]